MLRQRRLSLAMKVGREQGRLRRIDSQRWFVGNGKLLLLLLLCSFDRSPFTRDLGELLGALAIYNEGGTQPVECNFDIWISDGLKSGVDGLDKICRSPVWTLVSIFHPLLLESRPIFEIVRPQNIFPEYFFRQFPKGQFFLHHEPFVNNSKDYFYLFECFNRRESGSDPFL